MTRTVTPAGATVPAARGSAGTVTELADRFWEGFLERQPLYATLLGDERYDDRLDDPGPAGRAAEARAYRELLDDAARFDRDSLGVEDRITLDMLEVVARIGQAQLEHRLHQFAAIDQLAGPQAIPADLARFQRTDTPERFERLLQRLSTYPAYIDAHIENIREGADSRRTAAPAVVRRVLEQTRRIVESGADEAPLMTALTTLDEGQRARLRRALDEHVLPAQRRFLETLEAYVTTARSGDGVWAIPDGDAVYATAIVASTTLQLTPDELHQAGLDELARIDGERMEIARALGQSDVGSLRATLDGDPENHAPSGEAIVELARGQIARAAAAAPKYFGRHPQASCEVRAVEPYEEREAPGAFYYPPAPDGSRPGIYFVNTFDLASRPLHRLASTTYHEAVPGHHFQAAIETELPDLPAFRRLGSRLAGVAYTEGWGLYSERLADEMGLYEDARERFGMLDLQAMRAARLVVDTGLHAFRWDRERSVEFLVRIGLTPLEAENETDRYIAWPGQALAYTTGMREIQALRRELEARDGDRFDLRAFHDEVLGHGSLPLATLRRELPHWVRPAD